MNVSFGCSACTRPSQLTLYIASKDRHGNDIPNIDRVVDRSQRLFARLFGGCTVIGDAVGLWYAKERGAYIEETTAIVTSYVNRDDLHSHLDTLRALVTDILIDTDQDAVAVDLDGDLHYVYNRYLSICEQPIHMTQ